jgi:starch-binding outer membrane protein, SusD/RagB family
LVYNPVTGTFNFQNEYMKRTINKFLTVGLFAFMALGACKKGFLERTPPGSLPIDEALKDEAGLITALNGAYGTLRSVGLFGRDIPVIGDLHGDNTFVETQNSGRYLPWYNYSVTTNDGSATAMWGNAYIAIQRANQIINAEVTEGDLVPSIKAEARAIRALMYFHLVRTFAQPHSENPAGPGVPLILTYDPYFYPDTRQTIAEVYTQIIADLQAAYNDGPDYENSSRLSKYAIRGLMAKVYLNMGDYANALTAAEDVIDNGGFSLVTPAAYESFWADPAIRTDQVETLFEVDADVINNNAFDDLAGIYVNGYTDIYASRQLFDLYEDTDIRKSILVEGTTKGGASAVLVYKFPNAENADRDNLKVLRLSEMYLIAAEAAYRTSDEGAAQDYLNALMAQRDPANLYTSTGAALLADIIEERRKELAFEGDRLHDLNRLQMPIDRIANAGSIPAGSGNSNLDIPYPDNRRIAPIPQAELQANPGLADDQNPGY